MKTETQFKKIVNWQVIKVYDLESGGPLDAEVTKSYRIGEVYFYGVSDGLPVVFHWSDEAERFQGGVQE